MGYLKKQNFCYSDVYKMIPWSTLTRPIHHCPWRLCNKCLNVISVNTTLARDEYVIAIVRHFYRATAEICDFAILPQTLFDEMDYQYTTCPYTKYFQLGSVMFLSH